MNRVLSVDLLSLAFGIGAWVAINGLWVELPLLVNELPEGWTLPSYLSVIIQIANIGPISYSLVKVLRPQTRSSYIIYVVLAIGCLSSLLLCLFWDETTLIGGYSHSTALLVLVFFLALVDCTSSVLYIPYMNRWRDIYLPSYLIGEGLSGLLPALVALGQGVGGKTKCTNFTDTDGNVLYFADPIQPNFSVDIFFYIIFAMMVASSFGYLMLQHFPAIQSEKSTKGNLAPQPADPSLGVEEELNSRSELMNSRNNRLSKLDYALLLCIQAWSSMLSNGFMPSIQSYSCGPYGNVTYHLAATLSALANPLAALSTMFLRRATPKLITLLSAIGTSISAYSITMAVLSPSPPLMSETMGSFLVIMSWILFVGIISYVRVEIVNIMRLRVGQSGLFWSGAVTQGGSAVGALISFFLVNKTSIFVTYNPCDP